NQMMGSAATSLSQMLGRTIDISPPEATLLDLLDFKQGEEISPFLGGTFVKIAFRMQIGDLVDSNILQLYPIDFAKTLVNNFLEGMSASAENAAAQSAPEPEPAPVPYIPPTVDPSQMAGGMNNMGAQPMMQQPMMGMQPMMQQPMMQQPIQMNYQPAQFGSFAPNVSSVAGHENINLIMDVPLQVTVELGRTSKSISEILDFSPGTIIELDKIAGEPVDVLVNGKFVAKGEVVVIEESFGIRVTEIIR
ncbi:MAG: flagellar motor switch phosphatase FliY, partial [Lachnospiraceae bacterium]